MVRVLREVMSLNPSILSFRSLRRIVVPEAGLTLIAMLIVMFLFTSALGTDRVIGSDVDVPVFVTQFSLTKEELRIRGLLEAY